MRAVIGIDEVGYGPKLGPLVVTGCRVELPAACDPFVMFADVISRDPRAFPARLPVADSKRVFLAGAGRRRGRLRWPPAGALAADYPSDCLRILEAVALAGLANGEAPPRSFGELLAAIGATAAPGPATATPLLDFPLPLYDDVPWTLVHSLSVRLASIGGRIAGIRAVVLHPRRLNALCRGLGSKARVDVLSMLEVAAALEDPAGPAPTVLCGRAGGMRSYAWAFPPGEVRQVVREEARWSEYEVIRASRGRLGTASRYCFVQDVEDAHLAPALASLVGKYVRELFMLGFNVHFAGLLRAAGVPTLRPTAGYPADARRYLTELAAALGPEHVELRGLWREH